MYYFFVFANSLKHERASKKLVLTYRRDLISSCRDQLGSDLFFSFVNVNGPRKGGRREALRWHYYNFERQ